MSKYSAPPSSTHATHEAEKGYDEKFVMLYHSQIERLVGEPYALAVFVALLRRANREQGNRCFPSLNTIADDAGVSRSSVWRSIQKLVENGLLRVTPRTTESGDPTSNIYTVLRPCVTENEGGTSENRPSAPTEQTPVSDGHPNYTNSNEMNNELEDVPQPRQKRKTAAPDAISDAARSWARKQGLDDATIEREAQQFLDHHAAKGSRYVDWDRAFYTWVRNSIDWGKAKPAPTALPDRDLTQDELKQYSRFTDWHGIYEPGSDGFRQWQQDYFNGTLRQRRRS